MKLSKLYANDPSIFEPVRFVDGLNVILGSVLRPKRRDHDTHNLGKTLLAQLIDFCLLKKKDSDSFPFKDKVLQDFVFFLELRIGESFLTIRRSVAQGSKISFKRHGTSDCEFSEAHEKDWDHWSVPFEKARRLLDGMLDLTAVNPWTFRSAISYSLRTQKDFDEPFQLSKYKGRHADWKPLLAHVLGFDGRLVAEGYEWEGRIENLDLEIKRLARENGGAETPDQLRGIVEIAEREVASLRQEVERFDLAPADQRITHTLVDDVDQTIAELNEQRYEFLTDKARLEQSLQTRISIDLQQLHQLFEEANTYFGEQVVRDYDALIRFNRELVVERDGYLREELTNIETQLIDVQERLEVLNNEKRRGLEFIRDTTSVSKFKRLSNRLAERQAELIAATQRFAAVKSLQEKRKDLRAAQLERNRIIEFLEDDVESGSPRCSAIRQFLDEIVHQVTGHHANLFASMNEHGHIEFRIQLVDPKGKPTSAGDGFSYGRLLCIAFDMAVVHAYASDQYPHFVYHDGALETLDDRKKLNLIETTRELAKGDGVQYIWTAIESELPILPTGERFAFRPNEVVRRLTDEGDVGRLFKMQEW